MVIGVTGPYASGKSYFCQKFKKLGFQVIDADQLAHGLIKENFDQVKDMFSLEWTEDELSNRQILGKWIFSHKRQRKQLENFLHPLVEKKIIQEIEQACDPIIIEVLYLAHSILEPYCDFVFTMKPGFFKRLFKAIQRKKHSLRIILKIMWAQRNIQFYCQKVDNYTVRW